MGKIPNELREIIARNIKQCRVKKYPGRGGGKKCAEAFGVTPDELRLSQIADFFGVSVEWMRRDNSPQPESKLPESPPPGLSAGAPPIGAVAGAPPLPLWEYSLPGSPASFYWLAQHFVKSMEMRGLRLDKESLEYLAQCIKKP